MSGMWKPVVLGGLLLVAAGCERGPAEETAERRFYREAAHRQACAARILAERAEDDLELLTVSVGSHQPDDPIADLSRRASQAALGFGQVYARHAELRALAYAYLDSATNHAKTAEDSTRFIQRANQFSVTAPVEGTIEANAITSYQANLAAFLADRDHPCNWDFPF
jgi:hypothetical protein